MDKKAGAGIMEINSQQIIFFLIFLVVFQAFTYLLIFIRSMGEHRDLKLLVAYELAYIFGYSIIATYVLDFFQLFFLGNIFLAPLFATFPILVYYYIVVLTRRTLMRKQYLHLLWPASLFLLNMLFYSILQPGEIDDVIIRKEISQHAHPGLQLFYVYNQQFIKLVLGIQPFVYLLLSFITIRKQYNILAGQYSNFESLSLNWAKKVLIIFAILYSITFIYDSQIYFLVFILVVNGYLGVEAIRYQDTFLKLHVRDKIILKQYDHGTKSGCNLDMERKNQIQEKILQYMSNEKPYLNSDFSLIDLAKAIGENRQYVSNVINELFKKNFHGFVNSYRINWFLDHYRKKTNYSIDGMINQCGFKSKSSFYSAFKKVTGKTPKEFY